MSETPYAPGTIDPTLAGVPTRAERIYGAVAGYSAIVESAYDMPIVEAPDEHAALVGAIRIGQELELNPESRVSHSQLGLLAAVEAHTASLTTAVSLTENEQRTLASANASLIIADITSRMARARYERYMSSNDSDERSALLQERRELREYTSLIDENDGIADVMGVADAVASYKDGGQDHALLDKAYSETKANAYFAKYAHEIISNALPAEATKGLMTDDEVARARAQMSAMNVVSDNVPASQPDRRDRTQDSAEQERTTVLLDAIVRISQNHTLLNTDVEIGASGYKMVGDSPVKDYRSLEVPSNLKSYVMNRENNPGHDWRKELNEVAMFTDVERATTLNEATGKTEPTVRFRYQFGYGNTTFASLESRQGKLPPYKEFSGGRGGQHIHASVELPKSVAAELQVLTTQNPQVARALVERLFLENSNGKISSEFWSKGGKLAHPICPPYDDLPDDWTMAVITGQEGSRASDYSIQRVATA